MIIATRRTLVNTGETEFGYVQRFANTANF